MPVPTEGFLVWADGLRNLDDLVDWLGSAIDEHRPDAQRHADLDGVRWCLSRWDELQARIAQVHSVARQ